MRSKISPKMDKSARKEVVGLAEKLFGLVAVLEM
jgi:hypothetical protein